MTKLYIIEGLPASGKSTAAAFVGSCLAAQGRRVTAVDEGTGDHPADYEFHAFVDGRIVSLAGVPAQQLPFLMPHKIYDGLPWATEAPLMLEKWRDFVRRRDADATYVFNCVLLQNPMCESMMRFNLPEAASAAHIAAIAEIIAPLEPVVIYLHNDDVAESILRAAGERPGWLEAVTDYHVQGSYGRSIGAQGFSGYVDCLLERQRREERILQSLPLRSLVLDNPQRNWPAAQKRLLQLCQECL